MRNRAITFFFAYAVVAASVVLGVQVRPAAAFGGVTDEAVMVWQHRDTGGNWDIWYSVVGHDVNNVKTWHAAGGPAPQAAPLALLAGDDKNPHVTAIGTGAGTLQATAVWQHASGTGATPGDWDIFFSTFTSSTATWTAP